MNKYKEAKAAIARIAFYNADTVNSAGRLIIKAIELADASSANDGKMCSDLVLQWRASGDESIRTATKRFNQVGNQLSEARAYTAAGQSGMGNAVAKGTAEGAIEMCDDIIAFSTAYQSNSEAIEERLAAKLSSEECSSWSLPTEVITWRILVKTGHYGELADNARTLKSSSQSMNATAQRATTTTSSGGCYVATAVYGSYDCPQVWTLRRYRDFGLAQTRRGRAFIKAYYAVSPTVVRLFGDAEWFNKLWRNRLDGMVERLQAEGFDSSPYEDKPWQPVE